MKILSHRGYWKTPAEKNALSAFERSFSLNFGTETDLRDHRGQVVISHDMPGNDDVMDLETFFSLLPNSNDHLPLALNIKADGLASLIKPLLHQRNIKNYFFFDMSIPDMLSYLKNDLRVFSRVSEYEPIPAFYNKVAGIWLDAFEDIWYSSELIHHFLASKKEVCLVSPELHGRDHLTLWTILKNAELHQEINLMLCTDFPEEAEIFFDSEAVND